MYILLHVGNILRHFHIRLALLGIAQLYLFLLLASQVRWLSKKYENKTFLQKSLSKKQ